jgi:PIN domain nuclease of toxin-antitoxin system
MAMLLDTNALVWIESGDPRLGAQARRAIETSLVRGEAFVCPIVFWEIGLLVGKGRLWLDVKLADFRQTVLQGGYVERPIDGNDTVAMADLENFHADPADRLLVTTARNSGLTLVTADRKILAWPGTLRRMDGRR